MAEGKDPIPVAVSSRLRRELPHKEKGSPVRVFQRSRIFKTPAERDIDVREGRREKGEERRKKEKRHPSMPERLPLESPPSHGHAQYFFQRKRRGKKRGGVRAPGPHFQRSRSSCPAGRGRKGVEGYKVRYLPANHLGFTSCPPPTYTRKGGGVGEHYLHSLHGRHHNHIGKRGGKRKGRGGGGGERVLDDST